MPSTLSSVIDFWQSHPDCGCVYGDTLRMNNRSELIALDPTLRKPPYPTWFIRYRLLIPHCSLFFVKTLVTDNNIVFDLSFKYAGDWDWIIRLSQATKFAYLNKPLSVYREHAVQTSQSVAWKTLRLENREILKRYQANYFFYCWLVNQHRFLKMVWILRTQGFSTLCGVVKTWLARHNAV